MSPSGNGVSLGVLSWIFAISPILFRCRLRAYLINLGIGNKDPWSYRFFPTELAFFLLGSLSHQILLPLYQKISSRKQIILSNIATYFLICFTLFYRYIPTDEIIKKSILFIFFILLIPLTFIFQNKNNIDKEIGNLSYPIYICHILVLQIATMVLIKIGLPNPLYITIVCVIISVVFAWLLNKFIAAPFERLREKFRTK